MCLFRGVQYDPQQPRCGPAYGNQLSANGRQGNAQSRLVPVRVPLPDKAARSAFFERAFKYTPFSEASDLDHISERTESYSYIDLDRVAQRAKLALLDEAKKYYLAREGRESVQSSDYEEIGKLLKQGTVSLTVKMIDDVIDSCKLPDRASQMELMEQFEKNPYR